MAQERLTCSPLTPALLAAWLTTVGSVAGIAQAQNPATAKPPATPPWVAKPAAWPGILLTNRVAGHDKSVGFSGSAGLVRLPNDVVVVMTARHLLGDVPVADFGKAYKSWTVVPTPGSAGGVPMKSVAMDDAGPKDYDALVLLPSSQNATWPATVLRVRTEPLEVGETVYLVGLPAEGTKGRQTVRKATITKRTNEHEVIYAVEGTFKTMGNSGAPVVDSKGQFCAINTAHLNDQNEPGKMLLAGIDASDVLRHIKLPAGMKPLVLPDATAKPAATADQAAGGDENAEASKMLDAADGAKENGLISADAYQAMLKQVIDQYPNSSAAKKARTKIKK